MRLFAILAVFLTVLSAQAFAADPPMPAPLQALVKEGADIRYLGHDNGLDGWVTFKNGQEQYFYVTPDQQGIVLGVLFNNKGDVTTMRQIQALRKNDPSVEKLSSTAQAPDAATAATDMPATTADAAPAADPAPQGTSKAEQLFAAVESSSWIALGQKNAPVIYSFIDPQCPHCHDMIQDVRKSGMLDKGQLQLRLVPVGLMNESSLKQAANLLSNPNPAAVLYKHLDGDKNALLADPNPNTQAVQRNMVLMQDWKLDVTPFSIYRNKKGEIKILRGRPNDLKALVSDLK